MRRTLLLSILMIVLSGCSQSAMKAMFPPVYETQYTFTSPDEAQGKMCVMQCQMAKNQCHQFVDSKTQMCLQNEAMKYQNCQLRVKNGEILYCSEDKDKCSPDYSQCEEQYRTCYETCGGKVDSKTVCTQNCD